MDFPRPPSTPPTATFRQDAELVAACLAGEREAFVELVRRHQSLVCAVAWEQTGRLAVSEEIAQETFVMAWRKLAELREPGSLRTWLKRIAHGLSVDWVRKQKPSASMEELDLLASDDPWPDEAAADREENALVWKAVESLPEATRLPLILFYREEQNIAAVALALDLSEEAVRQRLSRGRAALRDRLAEVAEQVLGKSRPGAVFTFSVMAAIGGLALPAALAAIAFSGTSALAAGTLTAGAAPVMTISYAAGATAAVTQTTTWLTAMSLSKITLTIAAALAVLLIPVGWSIRRHQTNNASVPQGRLLPDKSTSPGSAVPDFKSSALYAEWKRLHEEHGTTKEAMPALYKAISDIKDTFRRRAFRAALIAEWVELDAPGALGYFRTGNRNDMAEQTMREWMLRDPHAAVAALMASGSGWESLGRTLLGDIARLTPGLVPAVASQLPLASQPQWDTTVKDAFAMLAAKNLESARAEAEALTGPHRDEALAGVAAAWAALDPQAALAWTQALPEGETRTVTLRGLLLGWAKTDPAAALDHVDLVPPGGDMMSDDSDVASQMLTAAADKDFGATMRWLKENPGKIGFQSMRGMMSLLSDKLVTDTAGTLAFLQKEAPLGMSMVLSNALLNQGYTRAAEIRAWLDAQPPGDFVDATRLALIGGTALHDPTALLAWVKEMPAEQKTPEKLKEIASRLLNGGSDVSRIDELIATSPPELSAALISAGFGANGGWPGGDVKPWLARLEKVAPEDRARSSAILAGNWTATDPDAAVAWATALPDEDARKQSYAAIAGRWAQADSYEASQWIATLPAGAGRDAATRTLVGITAEAEPDSAWAWARQITDPQTRFDSMAMALAGFSKTDPAAGRAALQQTTGLVAADRAHFQAVLDNTTRGPRQSRRAPGQPPPHRIMKRSTFFSPAPLLCCALAAALGLGAGWLIHRARGSAQHLTSSAGDRTDPSDQSDQSSPTKMPAGGKSQATSAAADAKNNALAEALATSPRIERWLLLVTAAEKATPDEMPGLLRLCQGDNAALRMVAARWAELNPAHMWQTLRRLTVGTEARPGKADASGLGLSTYDLAQLLLESWTPRDQSAVIAALSAAKDFPGIENLRMNALETFVKTDPESALRAMRDWESRRYVPRMDSVRLWAEKNPQHAAAIAAQVGTTAGGREALATVGKAWAMSDPKAALAYAATLPAVQQHALAAGAMVEWGGRDAQAAAAYLSALPDATLRAGLAPFLVESWAKAAPQQALDWAQDTLRGEARATALGSIVGSIARQDVTRAAELVAGLDAGGSKNKAISSLVDQWFQKDGAAPIADWLLKLPEADAREAGFEKLGFQWLWNSGGGGALKAAELAIGPHRELVPETFVAQIASNEARHDPEAAMKWAAQLPPDRIPQARERVLVEWMQSRPEAAAQWVLEQPAGDTRRDLVASATRHFGWGTSPGAAGKFFAQLTAAERVHVRESLRTLPVPEEKRRLLEAAFQTP